MKIIESIQKHPEQWTQQEHYLTHDSGLKIWTANGFFFYNTHPDSSMGLGWKIRFARAYRKWSESREVFTEA